MESKLFILIHNMVWNRAAATVQLIMLASSHPESIFTPDCLALCRMHPLGRSAQNLSQCLLEKHVNDGLVLKCENPLLAVMSPSVLSYSGFTFTDDCKIPSVSLGEMSENPDYSCLIYSH